MKTALAKANTSSWGLTRDCWFIVKEYDDHCFHVKIDEGFWTVIAKKWFSEVIESEV